jgi:molecular chaperone GrpE
MLESRNKAAGAAEFEDDDRAQTRVKVTVSQRRPDAGAAATAEEALPAGPAAEAALPEAAPPGLCDDLERLQQERDQYYDRLLRQAAEFENYRKRVERERREQAEYAATDVLRSLLPLVDGMERALAAPAPAEAEPYRKGVEIIHRQMLDVLRRHGVTPIEAVGQPFDPHRHEAVLHEESPGHADGEVIEELQRGYRLGDRLLRPAMVKVAKA